MLQENKHKEYYERICNGLFSPIYQILFGEEAPSLSPEGKTIVQAHGDWYITSDRVYIRMSGSIKAPHCLPHFVPDTLLLQEIAYQLICMVLLHQFINPKKGLWPPLPLSKVVYKI